MTSSTIAAFAEASEILSGVDVGSKTCVLCDLEGLSAEALLNFGVDDEKEEESLTEILRLRKEVCAAMVQPGVREGMTASAVSRYIFNTNKLDFCSTAKEANTLALIVGQRDASSEEDLLVTSMMRLLSQTYLPNTSVQDALFQPDDVLSWHKILSSSPEADFRKFGCFASSEPNPSAHQPARTFPHHSIVPSALEKLSSILPQMASYATTRDGDKEKLATVFRMAAFAQFHLADIHPFAAGNGSVYRFASKRLLDSVLPLPIAMFSDRSAYIAALEQGRKCEPCQAPALLLKLLLEATINTYTHLLHMYSRVPPYDALIMAQNLDLAERECKRQLQDARDRNIALAWFQGALAASIAEDEEEEVTLPSGTTCKLIAATDWSFVKDE